MYIDPRRNPCSVLLGKPWYLLTNQDYRDQEKVWELQERLAKNVRAKRVEFELSKK